MNSKPVAVMTSVVTVALAVLTALAGTGVLSGKTAALASGAVAILTAVLGILTHGKVTPVAAPKDNGGRPLVPLNH